MEPLPLKTSYTDEYRKSSPWAEAHGPGNAYAVMIRTGITPPGFPERAVYARKVGPSTLDTTPPCYVLEAGRFWEATEWRAFYRSHGCTPAEAARPNHGVQPTAELAGLEGFVDKSEEERQPAAADA